MDANILPLAIAWMAKDEFDSSSEYLLSFAFICPSMPTLLER